MSALKLVWAFLGKGGWILPVALVLGGWYRAELAAARREGARAAEIRGLNRSIDSLKSDLVYTVSYIRRDSALLARQRASLDSADRKLRQVAIVVPGASARADTLLEKLRDSLPELAGQLAAIGAAKDTIEAAYQAEHDARVIAERMTRRYAEDLAATTGLLDRARVALEQAQGQVKLLQGRHVSPIGLGCGAGPSIGTRGFQPAAISCGVTLRL